MCDSKNNLFQETVGYLFTNFGGEFKVNGHDFVEKILVEQNRKIPDELKKRQEGLKNLYFYIFKKLVSSHERIKRM